MGGKTRSKAEWRAKGFYQCQVLLSEDDHNALDLVSRKEGIPKSEVVRRLIRKCISIPASIQRI